MLVALLLTTSFGFLNSTMSAPLPTFEDFRHADHERRLTGQRQTAESTTLMRVDTNRIARVVSDNRNNPEIRFGVAELQGDWPPALEANGTNAVVAFRFACASAVKRDYSTALRWFRYCQTNDIGNLVPWLGELWVLRQQRDLLNEFRPPADATDYRDYAVPAARARIRLLEKAGYSSYAARRIGLMQNTFVESMAQDLSRDSNVQPPSTQFLLNGARALQRRPTFLLTELVGQSLERAALAAQPNAGDEPTENRLAEIDARRGELKQLVAVAEHRTADFATEREMVEYFDNVLAVGEESAMRRLAVSVRGNSAAP